MCLCGNHDFVYIDIHQIKFFNNHYGKLCPSKLNSHATRATNQLLYNYITISPWKYSEIENKITC
jgi:hypothetical protein